MPQLFFWFIAAPVVIAVAMAAALGADWSVEQVEAAWGRFQNGLDGWRASAAHRSLREQEHAFRERDHAEFLHWARSRIGAGRMPGAVDEVILEAQRQAELIYFLIEREVPSAVSQCCRMHKMMAQISGAWHLEEIAYEPECLALRKHSVWLLSHTAELLQTYPLKFHDPRMLHNSVVLRKRAVSTCSACPYIEYSVDNLPELCATAQLFQIQGTTHANR